MTSTVRAAVLTEAGAPLELSEIVLPDQEVRALTGGIGADHAFEVVGKAATIRTAWSATRRGGHTTVVGVSAKDDPVSFGALELWHFDRTLTSSVFGSCDPERDVPVMLDHSRRGSLDLGGLVTA